MIISEMQCKLAKWSEEDKQRRFTRVLRLVADPTWLRAAAERALTSPGAKTPGVDGVTRDQINADLTAYLSEVRETLLDGSYQPLPVRRIYIPKSNGRRRPLGIPCLRDRIVQRAMMMAMEPIWESDFHRNSYGFRPRRSVHHAIGVVTINLTDTGSPARTKGRWVIEGDLASYFDTVHHPLLIRCVKKRIRDKRFIDLLWRMLKAGHVDKRIFRVSTEGVPQGGCLSPLLSNIMLHEFDSYLEERYLSHKVRYRRQGWNTSVRRCTPIALREKRSLKPAVTYVRYADDFVALVKGTRAQAEAIREEFRQFLSEKLKLTLNMDKTHVTHVNEGFVFLGHRIVRKRSGKGHMRPVTGIPRQSARRFAAEITQLLSSNYDVNKVVMIERINRKIAGWTSFYRHTMYTGKVFQKLDTIIFWKLGHWLARKYRTRVNKLMRKWYGYSVRSAVKTWVVYQKVDGQTRSAALRKCIHSAKYQRGLSIQHVNPYRLSVLFAKTCHRSHFDIATMTST